MCKVLLVVLLCNTFRHFCNFLSEKVRYGVLAHRIRIYEILPLDRKSYLTKAILPRLSRESFIHWLYWNSRTWSSSDVLVMLK